MKLEGKCQQMLQSSEVFVNASLLLHHIYFLSGFYNNLLNFPTSRFTDEYHKEPDRGYGFNVVTVFEGLRNPKLKDVYEPARVQFEGSGSYGNGGAMRIAPASLFAFATDKSSELQVFKITCI